MYPVILMFYWGGFQWETLIGLYDLSITRTRWLCVLLQGLHGRDPQRVPFPFIIQRMVRIKQLAPWKAWDLGLWCLSWAMWLLAGSYRLGLASGSWDVCDLVVLDTTRGVVPLDVQSGGGGIEHQQVLGRACGGWEQTQQHKQPLQHTSNQNRWSSHLTFWIVITCVKFAEQNGMYLIQMHALSGCCMVFPWLQQTNLPGVMMTLDTGERNRNIMSSY